MPLGLTILDSLTEIYILIMIEKSMKGESLFLKIYNILAKINMSLQIFEIFHNSTFYCLSRHSILCGTPWGVTQLVIG